MRLIDADAMEKDLREQFEQVFTLAGRKVKPEDYYIKRRGTYFADVQKAECDSFFAYLQTRPTIGPDSPERRGRWEEKKYIVFDLERTAFRCSECKTAWDAATKYCPNCGAWMQED